jgi:HEAT repeat protein
MRRLTTLAAVACLLAAGPAHAQKANDFLGKSRRDWLNALANTKAKAEDRRAAAFALGKIGAEGDPKPVVKALIARLGDDDAGVRDAAAAGLADVFTALGDAASNYWPDAGPVLQKRLEKDDDARVRRSAACALGALGSAASPARDALQTALFDKASGVRQNAAWALGRLGADGGEGAVDALAGLLKDPEPLVRRDAAAALGDIGKPTAKAGAAALLDMLPDEKDGVVRRTALQSLSELAGPEDQKAAGVLVGLLDDPDAETRWKAAFVLTAVGGPSAAKAAPVVREALQSDDPSLQELAAVAAARLGDAAKPLVEDLGKLVTGAKDGTARRNAALALARIGPAAKAAVPQLAEALRHKDDPDAMANTEVRLAAAEALASIKYPANEAAVPALLDVIRGDPEPLVRQRCVWALFELGDLNHDKAVAVLASVLDETGEGDDKMVRYDAARVLALRLRDKAPDKTVDVLLDMLKNDQLVQFNQTEVKGTVGNEGSAGKTEASANQSGDARFMAARALGWLGKKANRPDVVGALQDGAKAADKRLREEAQGALKMIRP